MMRTRFEKAARCIFALLTVCLLAAFAKPAFALRALADANGLQAVLTPSRPALSFGSRSLGPSDGYSSWVDPNHELTPEAVAEGNLYASQRTNSFGYTSAWVWARIDLVNGAASGSWVTELSTALVEEVDFYRYDVTDDGARELAETKSYRLGHAGERGSLHHRLAAFKSDLNAGEHSVIVLRVASLHALTLGAEVLPERDFSYRVANQQQFLGTYFGVLLAVAVVNLLIYFATREPLYLEFVLHVVTLGLTLSNASGTLDFLQVELGFGNARQGNPSDFLASTTSLGVIGALFFAENFLGVRAFMPRLAKLYRVVCAMAAAVFLFVLTPYYANYRAGIGHAVDFTIFAGLALILYASVDLLIRRREASAGWFIAAWACFCASVLLYFGARYGWIPHTVWLDFPIETGAIGQMLLLTPAVKVLIEKLTLERAESEHRARDSERIRTLFHLTCHDLASPLNVVQIRSQLEAELAQEEGRERDARAWRVIERASSQQRAILDFVRTRESVEIGKIRVKPRAVRFDEVIDNIEFLFTKPLREKNISLEVERGGFPEGVEFLADPTLLHHTVINNLVSNALKFTRPGGTITVGARHLSSAGTGAGRVRLSVRDTGIGIPAELRPGLFSERAATTRPGTEGETGNGFGLPLVKSMVLAMGGNLGFESVTEEEAQLSNGSLASGTTFWVDFPVVTQSEAVVAPA